MSTLLYTPTPARSVEMLWKIRSQNHMSCYLDDKIVGYVTQDRVLRGGERDDFDVVWVDKCQLPGVTRSKCFPTANEAKGHVEGAVKGWLLSLDLIAAG